MRLLLDTHAAIWALASAKTIPERIRNIIADDQNEVFVSVVSLWEIGIKFSRHGRGRMPLSSAEAFARFRDAGYAILDVRAEHAVAVEAIRLPRGDPFDRLILAQALSEPLILVTKDSQLAAYDRTIINW